MIIITKNIICVRLSPQESDVGAEQERLAVAGARFHRSDYGRRHLPFRGRVCRPRAGELFSHASRKRLLHYALTRQATRKYEIIIQPV